MTEFNKADYVTPAHAAKIAGVSGETVRNHIKQGKIPAVRTHGGRFLIHKDDVCKLAPSPVEPDQES